jgi:hypothetical protein
MEISVVDDKQSINKFHQLPFEVYRDDRNWVQSLRMMAENSFNPLKNAVLEQGEAQRWIVMDKKGSTIGRIAAFYTKLYSSGYEQPTGCIGFFECFDNQQAAGLLFDTARKWLELRGMEAMDGLVNLGENFFNWGVLADGFKQQTFGMPYHMPYYRTLMEGYGFRTYYEQYSYRMDITSPDLPQRFWRIAEWVAKKPDFTYEHFSFKYQDKYIRDFITIYEQAWKRHDNFKAIEPKEIAALIRESEILLDEEFIWYVYHKGEPVAFFMMVPDLNQIVRKLNGDKLTVWNIIRMLYYKRRKTITRCRVVAMGVVPRFQKLGLESGIFYQLRQVMLRKPWYNEMELSWVGDFNPKMIALFKAVGATHEITHHTMRYLFDRSREFKRLSIITD